jgi:AcrR family transcriptional regulator
MVEAAYDLFSRRGYAGTTVTAVAEQAGVAVPTIYYTFGTKAALLGEALGAAVLGFEAWRPPQQEPVDVISMLPWHAWWSDFAAAPTAAAALHVFIPPGVEVLHRVGPLVPALHGASSDDDAAEIARLGEERRVQTYREVVRIVAGKEGGLAPGLTLDEATDMLVVLFSSEVYQALVGRRWSYRRRLDFFHDILPALLLGGRSTADGGYAPGAVGATTAAAPPVPRQDG